MCKRRFMLVMLVLLILSTACLEIQGTHTLYLDPGGSVVWTVLEEEIRFEGPTREARARQAELFLDRVTGSEHEAAMALEALSPGSMNTRVLREETPQTLLTEAYYPGIDRVYQNLFDLYEVPASVELRIRDARAHLEIYFWPRKDEPGDDENVDDESAADDREDVYDRYLLALLLECRIVLTEGRFIGAKGFEIVDGGRAATPLPLETEEAERNDTPVTLSLSWETLERSPHRSRP